MNEESRRRKRERGKKGGRGRRNREKGEREMGKGWRREGTPWGALVTKVIEGKKCRGENMKEGGRTKRGERTERR